MDYHSTQYLESAGIVRAQPINRWFRQCNICEYLNAMSVGPACPPVEFKKPSVNQCGAVEEAAPQTHAPDSGADSAVS